MKKIILNLCSFMICFLFGVLFFASYAEAYTYNISTEECTNNQGCYGTGYGYYGEYTYFNIWDPEVTNSMKSVNISIYKDGRYITGNSSSAKNYMNYVNMGFAFYETGYYTYQLNGTMRNGGTFNGSGDFYIKDTVPSIYSCSSSQTIMDGDTATFSVEAQGTNLSYQWYYTQSSTQHSGTPISGATDSSYAIKVSSSNASDISGKYYYCKVYNYGNDAVYSQNAKLSVMYLIKYNANGGSGAPANQNKYHGTDLILSNKIPARDGYTFVGWAEENKVISAMYMPGGKYIANAGTTLRAVWNKKQEQQSGTKEPEKKQYTIKYNANGGSGVPSDQTKYEGTDLTLSSKIPTREGYEFIGWSTDSKATNAKYMPGGKYTVNVGVTLYAVWNKKAEQGNKVEEEVKNPEKEPEKKQYTVKYNANGGSGAPNEQIKYEGVDLVLSSKVPIKEGYEFVGWATEKEAVDIVYLPEDNYVANIDVVLYAVWIEEEIYEEAEGDEKADNSDEEEKNNQYTIKYNANGGTGAPANQIKYSGKALVLSLKLPERKGYDFLGWSTDSKAKTAKYFPGATYTADKNITLYAVWSIEPDDEPENVEEEQSEVEMEGELESELDGQVELAEEEQLENSENKSNVIQEDKLSVQQNVNSESKPIDKTSVSENDMFEESDSEQNFDRDDDRDNGLKETIIVGQVSYTKSIGDKPFNLVVGSNSDSELLYKSSNKSVVSVSDSGKVKIKGYGEAVITVKSIQTSNYSAAEKKIKVKVIPGKIEKFKSVSSSKGTIKCTWKKKNIKNMKCEIQVSLNSGFNDAISFKTPSVKKGKYMVAGLERGKTYYIRIRAVKSIGGKKYKSKWSKVTKTKVK